MSRRPLLTCAAVLALLASSAGARAAGVTQVKDLATATDGSASSKPQPLAATHPLVSLPGQPETFFFSATDARNGRELWKTDGTHTDLVKDIRPGPTDSLFGAAANCAGTLVFAVDDGVHGMEPWRSDGTPQGTYLLKDLSPGSAASTVANMRLYGNTLYFDATLGNGSKVLYQTDGTPAGTVPAHLPGNVRIPSVPGQKEIYWVTTGNRPELWESDGTPGGTSQVSESLPPRNGQNGLWPGNGVFGTSTKVYAWVNTENGGQFINSSLAVVDRKTKKISYILQNDMDPHFGDGGFVELGGKVYFDASALQETWANDVPVWVTEGTKATRFASAGNQGNLIGFRHGMFTHGGKLFFVVSGYGRDQLFSSDGTTTTQIVPLLPANKVTIGPPVDAGSLVYFTVAQDSTSELWQSDGTAKGTHAVHGVKSGSTWLRQVGADYYTDASDAALGQELWRFHEGAAISLVKDIGFDAGSSSPYPVGDIGGKFLFGATVPATGTELYGTDGTGPGTSLVKDISPGAASGSPGGLGVVGSALLLVADDPTHGRELWSTAGTSGSTMLVKDIQAGTADSSIEGGIVSSGTLFFGADDGKSGSELWISNGSGAGTRRLNDIWPGAPASTPLMFSLVGSQLLFAARQQATGLELWKTDPAPTASSTELAHDICQGGGDSSPTAIIPFGGAAYFVATDCKSGHELWSRAGTTTKLVKDIHPGPADSGPTLFAVGAHFLFFVADDGVHGPELWKTDGTAAGTVLVKDVLPGAAGADIHDVVTLSGGDVVLFTASDGVSGRELWRSDGTAQGTTLVKDIWPGELSSDASSMVLVRPGIVAFAASDGNTGMEPWRSDGTAAGTTLVTDVSPGAGSSNPVFLGNHGASAYVSAYGPGGCELYAASAQGW